MALFGGDSGGGGGGGSPLWGGMQLIGGGLDKIEQTFGNIWNTLTGAAANTAYNDRFGPAANRVNDVSEWAGQYGMDQVNAAGNAAPNQWQNYFQNRNPTANAAFTAGQWQPIVQFGQQQFAEQQGVRNNLFADVQHTRDQFDIANQQRLNAAEGVYGNAQENTQFQMNEFQRLLDQGQADVQRIQDLGADAIGDTQSRVDAAIQSRINTVGESMKSITEQSQAMAQDQMNQLDTQFQSGAMSEGEYRRAKRQIEQGASLQSAKGQIGLMASQADAYVQDRMNGAKLMSDVRSQFANIEAGIRSSVGQQAVSGAGNVNVAAGQELVAGQTLLGAHDDYVKGVLAGGTFEFEAGNALAGLQLQQEQALNGLMTGEAVSVSNAFLADDQMNAALNQFSTQLTQGVAAANAQAAGNLAGLVSSGRQFEMAGAMNQAQLMTMMMLNPANLGGYSNWFANMQNAYQAGGGGGGGSGTDWGAIGGGLGTFGGMALGAGGGPMGMMMGGMMGNALGGTAGYLGGQ